MIPIEKDIYIGTTIQKSYCKRHTLQVVEIFQNCTCPNPMDWYERREEKPTAPHYHFVFKQLSPIETGWHTPAYANHYIFKNGVWQHLFRKDDRIIILSQPQGMQLELF